MDLSRDYDGPKKKPPILVNERSLAPAVGLEPTTVRLTVECSAIELRGNNAAPRYYTTRNPVFKLCGGPSVLRPSDSVTVLRGYEWQRWLHGCAAVRGRFLEQFRIVLHSGDTRHLAIRLSGYPAIWLSGYLAIRLCGRVPIIGTSRYVGNSARICTSGQTLE